METKPAKSFEECKNEAAKKFGFKDFEEIYSTERKDWSIGAIYEEAAELYNQETAAECDRLKEENEKLKEDRENRIARELNLEEENERLKEEIIELQESKKRQLQAASHNLIAFCQSSRSLCSEKIRHYCMSAFLHKDVDSVLPFEYTDDNFESWAKNNLK